MNQGLIITIFQKYTLKHLDYKHLDSYDQYQLQRYRKSVSISKHSELNLFNCFDLLQSQQDPSSTQRPLNSKFPHPDEVLPELDIKKYTNFKPKISKKDIKAIKLMFT